MKRDFFDVKPALESGMSVRFERWDSGTRIRIEDGEMMQSNPRWKQSSSIQLSWAELTAKGWSIIASPTLHLVD